MDDKLKVENESTADAGAVDIDAILGDLEIDEHGEDAVMNALSDLDDAEIEQEVDKEIEILTEALGDGEEIDPNTMSDQDIADLNAAIEIDETKSAIYAEQEASASDIATEAPSPAPAAATTPKKSKSAAPVKPKRVPVDDLPAAMFVLTHEQPDDLEANKLAVMNAIPAQKKVKEKFENIMSSIAAGRAPSVYVIDCFKALDAKKTVTSKDLVTALCATTKKDGSSVYTIGTAKAQAGQMMVLFPALKIATKSNGALTINPDSTLADVLRGFVGS